MDTPLTLAPSIDLARNAAQSSVRSAAPATDLRAKAEELEGVFLNTLMSQMFNSLDARNGFGGGYAEETWRSMQAEQMASAISKAGGLGLADQIVANLLANQESSQNTQSNQTLAAKVYAK